MLIGNRIGDEMDGAIAEDALTPPGCLLRADMYTARPTGKGRGRWALAPAEQYGIESTPELGV